MNKCTSLNSWCGPLRLRAAGSFYSNNVAVVVFVREVVHNYGLASVNTARKAEFMTVGLVFQSAGRANNENALESGSTVFV